MAVLLLHGWQGSGPGHWQPWLAERLRAAGQDVRFPLLPEPDAPRLEVWLGVLEGEHAALGPGATVLCHSLGCLLWLHHAARGPLAPPPARVLLVAPPSPRSPVAEIASFLPPPLDAAAVARAAASTRLLAGDDDPYCPEGAAGAYAAPLGVPAEVVPGGGHLNAEAGRGPWPALERWVLGAGDGLRLAQEPRNVELGPPPAPSPAQAT